MRKPTPLDMADERSLAAWLTEVRELTVALHATSMDATARARVHSRKELRRRLSKLTKRLHGLIDTVQPLLTPPCLPPAASETQERPRLVSVP